MAGERIGVYGGTFDPLHNGHIRVADALLRAFELDQLLFVPAYAPPHKQGSTISAPHHRSTMIALATSLIGKMLDSSIELDAPTRPYTIETLGRLKESNPEAHLFFVMGADSFAEVTIWREYERLLTGYGIIVAARPGFRAEELTSRLSPELQSRIVNLGGQQHPRLEDILDSRIFLTDYVSEEISSTQIRAAVAAGQNVDHLVPKGVANYIRKHRLYQQ